MTEDRQPLLSFFNRTTRDDAADGMPGHELDECIVQSSPKIPEKQTPESDRRHWAGKARFAATGAGEDASSAAAVAEVVTREAGLLHHDIEYPEGGLEAWSVVFGAFLLYFIAFGFADAFGVFLTYYENGRPRGPLASTSSVSWIGSFQVFCTFASSLIASTCIDRMSPRIIVGIGTFVHVVACVLMSFADKYATVFVAQGLVQGLGIGILISPALPCTAHYFHQRRGFAFGVVASGVSLGGIFWPIALDHLIHVGPGFKWAMRVSGLIVLILGSIASKLIRCRLRRVDRHTSFLDLEAFRHVGFCWYLAGAFVTYFGLFFIYYYLPYLGAIHGVPARAVFYFSAVSHAASFFGRIIAGYLGDRFGRFNVLIASLILSGIIVLSTIAAVPLRNGEAKNALFAIAATYGFVSAAYFALQAATVVSLVTDMTRIGTWIGTLYGVVSVPALVGPPIGSQIFEHKSFEDALAYAGICILAGALLTRISRGTIAGRKCLVAV